MVPVFAVQASSAKLTVAGAAVAGGHIAVSGEGMPKREWIQIWWDGSQDGMVTVRTTSDARFSTTVTIPSAAVLGTHMLSATSVKGSGGQKSLDTSGASLASVTVSVTTATVSPTPTPTPTVTVSPTPTPTPSVTVSPTPTPTPTVTASPTPTPTPTVTASPTPTPTPTPTTAGSSVRVTSIPALLTALANNAVTEIVVANGTYHASGASSKFADSLWIGARFASRTNPVLVRAETTGGVTFDGGGGRWWMGLGFMEGAHDQTWQGFNFANAEPTSTGVVTFGGYADKAGAHHITLRDITVEGSIVSQSGPGTYLDHALYFSESSDGVHDVLIDGWTVDGSGDLDSGIQFYSEPGRINARNVTIRNVTITGTEMAIILWASTLQNIVIEDATVTGATRFAVRYENPGTGIVLRRVVSTGSAFQGFYSSLGSNPPGVTFDNVSLR